MEKIDTRKVEERVAALLKSCPTCAGKIYYTGETGFTKKCARCFEYEIFLYRFKLARIDSNFIDITFADKLRQMMGSHLTFYIIEPDSGRQRKWAHSAAYLATRAGLKTVIHSDKDIIDTVFNKAEAIEGNIWMHRFLEPQFMVLFIGTVPNRNFIGSHIMEIFWERERARKFTVIIATTKTKVTNFYLDASLDYFLNIELEERKPKARYVNHSAVQKLTDREKEIEEILIKENNKNGSN